LRFYTVDAGVVGVIDGCLIKIDSPGGNDAELFRCRKTWFAVNVQGVCDSELNFTNLVARWYGSAHDSRVFENSVLNTELEIGVSPGIILGDSGYPCLPYLMPPLAKPTTIPEKRLAFN
jgi:nuclease HARBI1